MDTVHDFQNQVSRHIAIVDCPLVGFSSKAKVRWAVSERLASKASICVAARSGPATAGEDRAAPVVRPLWS